MKLEEAHLLIERWGAPRGYRVSFERAANGLLYSDYVPGPGENPLTSEDTAWNLAFCLARATVGKLVNFYVVDAESFMPVSGYEKRKIENR